MLHSKIEEILKDAVSGTEELEKAEGRFHSIEYEIDSMANKPEADLDGILRRAKELISRTLGDSFLNSHWTKIEDEIEKNLKELKG